MANAVYYTRVFNAASPDYHRVEIYSGYEPDQGLIGEPLVVRESGRMAECLKGMALYINVEQIGKVKLLGRDRSDGIILESGEYRKY